MLTRLRTAPRPHDWERNEFLQQLLLHALEFGITTTLVPIALELGAALLIDPGKLWQSIKAAWAFDLLLMAVFFLAGAFVGTVRFALVHPPGMHMSLMKSWTREAMIAFIESCHDRDYKTGVESKSARPISANPCRPLAIFLQALGLVGISAKGVRPVSPAADSFLMSLAAHLRDGNESFMADWRSGTNEPAGQHLIELVQSIEEHRIASAPGGNPRPARQVRAAIALIRADFGGAPHFLVIKSHTWRREGAWTPVMGGEEYEDGRDLVSTVRREVQEEMKLHRDDIVDVRELIAAKDKRVSKRLGLLTEYEYVIFAVQLRQSSPHVREFFVSNPQVLIDYDKAYRIHEFAWLTWSDLLKESHLRIEMPTVMEAMEKLHVNMVPQTVSLQEFI